MLSAKLTTAFYSNQEYPVASKRDIQKTASDIISSVAGEQLKSLPYVPENLKMRLGRLIEAVNLNPNDEKLKKDLFDLSTTSLYSSAVLRSSKANIVIMGSVHNDGLGDYYHILNAAELVKSKFPDIKITMLVSFMDDNLSSKVRKPIADIETIFYKFTQDLEQIYPGLEKADLVIEMSQQIPENFPRGDRYRFIGEYGHWEPQAMGLKCNQLGIIIKDKLCVSSMLDLKNEALKQILFGNPQPSKEDLENYLQTHEPFVGYLKMGSYYQMGFIYTAAAYMKSSGKEVIDIMVPPVKIEYLNGTFLKEQGIAKVKVIKIENGLLTENEIVLADKGKELRLINPFPLGQDDFYILLSHTNPLVGCTGDHSFSEAISFDRLPFYELRKMKLSFVEDLIELAGFVGKERHYLKQYFQELHNMHNYMLDMLIPAFRNNKVDPEEVDYFIRRQSKISEISLKIANLMKQPELFEECHQLNELLRTQYSFNETLQNIVERQLALNNFPDLMNLENDLKEKYLGGSISIYQAHEQLAEKIKAINNED